MDIQKELKFIQETHIQERESCHIEHKWLVLVTSFFVMASAGGFASQFGVLFVDILEEFGDSRASSALVRSLFVGMLFGTGLLNGALVNRIGLQKSAILGAILTPVGTGVSYFATSVLFLDISIGLIAGWGTALLYHCSTVVVGHNFTGRQKAMALSFITSGLGVVGLAYPYLLAELTSRYGLKGTFLIMSGLLLNCIPATGLWYQKSKTAELLDKSSEPLKRGGSDGNKEFSIDKCAGGNKTLGLVQHELSNKHLSFGKVLLQLCHNQSYILFVVCTSIIMSSMNAFKGLYFDILQSKQITRSHSLLAFLFSNIFSFFGQLSPGLLKQIPGVNALFIPVLFTFIAAASFLGIQLVQPFIPIVIISSVVGFATGGYTSVRAVVTGAIVKPDQFNAALGVLSTVSGISVSINAPICGLLYDKTSSYDIALYSSTGAAAVAAILAIVALVLHKISKTKSNETVISL